MLPRYQQNILLNFLHIFLMTPVQRICSFNVGRSFQQARLQLNHYANKYTSSSFASEDDQDFISRGGGGGGCAEMADQADLCPAKCVAVGTGDVRG